MYPQRELAALAARKALLQARVAVHRWECAQAMVELSRPISMVDRGIDMWRKISPFIKLLGIPASILGVRKIMRGSGGAGKISKLMGMMPIVVRVARAVMQMRNARKEAAMAG